MQEQSPESALQLKGGIMGRIREVWRHNMEQEMTVLRQLILRYPFVSMDAEFPGIVARPIGNFSGSKAEYHYQTLRCNVDILRPIQVGITLWTEDGELPPQQPDAEMVSRMDGKSSYANNLMNLPCTWVFNFRFSLEEDMYAESSIQLLRDSGVDFQRHLEYGIELEQFGSALTTSGLVFSEDVNWLSFHSGYDFGYLIKLLTDDSLPEDQTDFFEKVSVFFPKLWDIKFLLRHAQRMRSQSRLSQDAAHIIDALGSKSGLNDLAEELGCQRIGVPHTGGSDAWLTGSVFWAMRNKIFNGNMDVQLSDQIYGLHGVPAPASQQYREEFFAAQSTPGQGQSQGQSNGVGALGPAFASNRPSTPTNSHAALSGSTTTPGFGMGGGGGFGNFSYAK